MKHKLFYIMLFCTCLINAQNQKNDWKVIRFTHKDSINSQTKITPLYNKRGFDLVVNGVYDFIIDGKKHFQSIILKIEEDKFYISENWESSEDKAIISDSIKVDINQNIQIRLLSMKDGVGELPIRTHLDDYKVTIVPSEKYTTMQNTDVIFKDKKKWAYYYFTKIGFKKLIIVDNTPYFCEDNRQIILRRK